MERRYLSPRELAEYCGLSRETIYLWVRERKIPFIKKSRLIKFDKLAIDAWLKKDEIKSASGYEMAKIV